MTFLNELQSMVNIVCEGQSKPINKFINEMTYGLITSRSIKLSEIARSLNEDTKLLYTEKRLSRNLYGKININKLQDNYLQLAKKVISPNSIIAIDMCDVKKTYAKKMEGLGLIWDGSEHKIATGYNSINIEAVGTNLADKNGFPLSYNLHQSTSPNISESQNTLILKDIKRISNYFPNHTWVFDRGFDRKSIMNRLDELPVKFVIRQVGTRTINGIKLKKLPIDLPHEFKQEKRKSGQFGFQKVKLLGIEKEKLLIKFKRGKASMIFLSNHLTTNSAEVSKLIEAYFQRWGIEESIRFIKADFEIEDIRVLKYEGLQRMMIFVCLAYGFLCKLKIEHTNQIIQQVQQEKHFYKIPDFNLYRVISLVQQILQKEKVLI